MTIEERILKAMGRWLSERLDRTVEVISYYENYSSGTCGYGTCDYSDYEVTMIFEDSDGERGSFDYNDELSVLIKELT